MLTSGSSSFDPGVGCQFADYSELETDLEQTNRFLNLLDPKGNFTFQTFSESRPGNHELTQIVHSPSLERLVELHAAGASVFVTVNDTDGCGRAIKNIARVRAVWQEDDDDYQGPFPLMPSMAIQTSPGHFHRYWLVEDDWPTDEHGKADFTGVMERMVESYGADRNAKDLSRVLRLPGFLHRKSMPHLVRIVDASGRRYSRAAIIAAFPPVERQKKEQKTEWSPRQDEEQRIADALHHINADDRDVWLQCGMALKDHMGDAGRALWNNWSQRSDKFDKRDQDKTWRSFKRNEIGIGTLFYHAQQAGWNEKQRSQSNGNDHASDQTKTEPPRPLTRELPSADPFPIDALGSVLSLAARAINDRVQAPPAICGQSVLAAATLAVQGHANVELPMGHVKPISSYFVSVAGTGERKTAVDQEALWAVRKREAAFREAYASERMEYENEKDAWESARKAAIKCAKGDRVQIKQALDRLGPPPLPPLEPVLTCGEPTFEGLCKLLAVGWPSAGIFAAEGGQFIGGHGMADDAKLRTAAGLSAFWDGEPIKRIRALDGFTVLPGRRVAMHLMVQPDVAAIWFGDHLLIEQGLMSRVLLTAPDPTSGTRRWKEQWPESEANIKQYGARLLDILERPLPLAEGTRNELVPRTLPLSPQARRLWIAFYDHVETRLGYGGELEPVRGLANKLPEHAARIAATVTLVDDIEAGEVNSAEMEAGIALAEHYAMEALRLFGASRVNADVLLAHRLEIWLLTKWKEPNISLPDIYQRSLNAIGDQATARRLVAILEEHGRVLKIPGGATIAGRHRRDAWRIVQETAA